MSDKRANITLVVGSSGSGKSLWVKSRLDALPRPLIVFDPMREYSRHGMNCNTLALLIAGAKGGAQSLIYVPKQRDIEKQFDVLCGVALALPGCTLIAEELSFVTKAGYSPPRWREVITTGRHRGMTVIGVTQRPALVDKTILSNATVIRVGRLNSAGDKKTMADALDVSVDVLRELRPLDWMAKDMASGAVTRETLVPPGRSRDAAPKRAPRSVTRDAAAGRAPGQVTDPK